MRNEEKPICPACRSLKVVQGTLSGDRGNVSFALPNLQVGFWTLNPNPTLPLDRFAWLCLACGHLWSYIDPEQACDQLRRFGTAELKERIFGAGDTLPRPADPPAVDPRVLPTPSHRGK